MTCLETGLEETSFSLGILGRFVTWDGYVLGFIPSCNNSLPFSSSISGKHLFCLHPKVNVVFFCILYHPLDKCRNSPGVLRCSKNQPYLEEGWFLGLTKKLNQDAFWPGSSQRILRFLLSNFICSVKGTLVFLIGMSHVAQWLNNPPTNVRMKETQILSLVGKIPWSRKPLQYPCLGNPMDRRDWWAAVHGITKSQTQLSTHHAGCS